MLQGLHLDCECLLQPNHLRNTRDVQHTLLARSSRMRPLGFVVAKKIDEIVLSSFREIVKGKERLDTFVMKNYPPQLHYLDSIYLG